MSIATKYLTKLLIALTSTVVASAVALAGLRFMSVDIPILDRLLAPHRTPQYRFGFRAYYEIPNPDPDPDPSVLYCGTGLSWGPRGRDWTEGPHLGFDTLDPAQLAKDSLAWFHESPAADEWRGYEVARIELEYPSKDRTVTVRQVSDEPWDQQLAAWFERFPPSATNEDLPWFDGIYSWTITFGDYGEVRGWVSSSDEAIATMKRVAPDDEPSPFFGQPLYDLGQMVERAPRHMHCYSVKTELTEELGDLPHRLREQREPYD
jgi:hypothetical protein